MSQGAPNPFLDPELAARFAAGAIELLRAEPSLARLQDLARTAIYYADHCLARLEAEQPLPQPLACEPGCDACCHNQIQLTAPEAFLLSGFLEARFSPERRRELQQRAEQSLARRAGLSPIEVAAQRSQHPCPLLQEHRCLAYEARPLVCRAMHSLDAAACFQELADPLHPVVPFYSHRQIVYVSLSHGLAQVCRVFGMQAGPLDLAQALVVAAASPGALERWLSGETVFGG
ncbi:MAG: YkgJ family cysteine cluster protein [Desulfobacca sp.]|uniref:YkgJ family cysteine cluster protein n=1 Tax=Desulfobacca sp. TaxID=2067990 RepID=UPI004049613A